MRNFGPRGSAEEEQASNKSSRRREDAKMADQSEKAGRQRLLLTHVRDVAAL